MEPDHTNAKASSLYQVLPLKHCEPGTVLDALNPHGFHCPSPAGVGSMVHLTISCHGSIRTILILCPQGTSLGENNCETVCRWMVSLLIHY